MKSTLMRVVFTVSMIVACPIGASDAVIDAPAGNVPVLGVENVDTPLTDTTLAGWGICSIVNSVLSTPGSLHGKNPKITGILLLAVVGAIGYKIGTVEADEAKIKEGDLI